MSSYKDFSRARGEVENTFAEFDIGGENFKVNMNVHAGRMLKWMEMADDRQAVPGLLKTLLGDSEYDRLCRADIEWSELLELVNWLSGELGGSGDPEKT